MEPTCEEMQSEELEALAAILGDDFVLLPGTWKNQPAQFQMKVLPPTGQVEETYASVYIIMRYTKNYPKTAPVVEVQKKAGLSAEELKSLEKLLQTKARELVGEVMAWELIDTAKEYLAKHNNKPPVSFYEEMVMNRQKGQQESWQQSKEDNQSLASEATRRKELMTSNAAGRSDAHHADDLFGNKQRISPRGSSTEDWLMPFWDDPITADPYLSDFYGDGADTSASNDVREDEGEGLDKGEEHGAKRRLSKNKTMDAHHSHYPLNNNLLQGKGRGVDAHNLAGWLQQPAIQWKRRNTLGKGTFGEVILGMNLTTHKLMAVKEIDFGGVVNPSQTMEFVEQEIDSLRDLHHQHIVSYLGTERESNTLRIFLEFVAGASTIDALLRENGGFEETMLRKYTRQILEGLKYLHDRAIVHGDIKCPNMLLDHKGNIKLSDYGCSNQKIKSLLSGKGQTKDHPSDLMSGKQEDIYDLGLAVLQMADGVSRNRDKLPVLPSTLPTHAKDFLVSCFKKNPKDRPPVSKLLEHPFVADISTHNPWYLPGSPPSSIAPFMPRMKPLSESEPSSLTTSTESLSMQPPSRYRSDFEELEEIGRGGFGSVVKARNKLDGRLYAIKKIKLDPDDHSLNQKILREVTTLSRLNHQYVVRYYQAWTEGGVPGEQYGYSSSEEDEGMTEEDEEEDWFGSATSIPPSFMTDKPVEELECNLENEDPFETDSEDDDDDDGEERAWIKDDFASDSHDDSATATDDAEGSRDFEPVAPKEQISNKQKPRLPETLYIQMEYCSRNTLRQEIDKGLTEEEVWRLFRQILEGLNHIHLQGIIHRDLKPSNVFLDANSNIKIGDFGLATTGAGRVAKKDLRSASNESNSFSDIGSAASKESHTIGVGTPFYCSPEQLKEGMHYDQKVDTYSLGIILFEMCYPLATAMERVKTLTALRENMDFPPDFKSNHPVESELITWLLQEDPSARPTTMELLKSDLLPPKLEEEILKEALRTITIPGTTIFSLLMEKLFSFEPDEHLDYTYDAHTGKAHSTTELLVREKVFNEVTAIFKRHGAVLVETSLLMPKSPLLEQATNVAGLLDDAGTPIMLPYNLTLPFARYAAHREPITLKRYNIDRVYRKNPAGGHPRELYECDFDIIGPTACTLVHDAEVIRVIGEVLDVFSHSLGPFIIRLNHHKIFEAVLEVCEFPTNTYAKVCSAIEQLWRKKGPRNQANVAAGTTSISFSKGKEQKSWAGIAKSLLRLEGVTQKAVEALAQFVNMRGDMETTLRKLGRLLRRQKRGMEGVNDLKVLTRYLQSFNMLSKVVLDVGLVHNWAFYDGIIFHAVLQNSNSDVIAAGGRYDELVAKFRSPHSTKSSMAAVGVNIAIAKIINTVIMHEQRKSKKEGYRLRNCETEVFVCSVGRNMVEERISIATELWSRDIKAEYMHPPKKSLGEMYIFCKQAGIPWMVNLKDRSYDSEERLKVKNVMSNVETELHRSELADFLVAQLRGKRSALSSVALPTTTTTKPSELPPQISSHQPAAPATKQQHKGSLDVVFLNDTISAKKKTRIRTEANRAICKNRYLLNSLNLESVKVLALELPFHVIKEIVAGGSGASSLDGSGEQAADKLSTHYNMHPLIQKYPRYSSNIRQLRDFIVDKGRNFPILFLFSVLDEKFELMLVQ